MKRILMVIMTVAISFSAHSFADEGKKDKKDEKKGGHADTFGDKKDVLRLSDLTIPTSILKWRMIFGA